MSMRAAERYDAAVRAVAGFIGAVPEEIVFTQNTTHAINLVAHTLDFAEGDEIVLTSLEHTSNMAPWVRLGQTDGGALPVIAVNGKLVATGTPPNLMDALDLANGKPVPAAISLTAPAEGCSPDCC